MTGRQLDESWRGWLRENIERGCDTYDLYDRLVKRGFAVSAIREEMGEHFPENAESPVNDETDTDFDAFARPRITRPDNGLNALQVITDKLQLYVLDDFLNDAECDRITEVINRHLRPSTVTRENEDKAYRTSTTSDLALLTEPKEKKIVKAMDDKIARTLGIALPYSEGIQAQRYDIGQEFKKHTDFFAPNTPEYAQYADKRGQRTWTFMVYLNDVPAGGGTRFFAIDKVFMPQKGRAVIWNNLHPDGTVNHNTLHAGLPVEDGHKIIITKWFRVNGRGPVFYDDA